jgi:hypothetical protein
MHRNPCLRSTTGWTTGVRLPAGQDFYFRHNVQTSCGVKRPRREADYSPPSRAEVKNVQSFTSTSLYICMSLCLIKQKGQFYLISSVAKFLVGMLELLRGTVAPFVVDFDCGLLGHDVVRCSLWPSARPHGVKTQKTAIDSFTAGCKNLNSRTVLSASQRVIQNSAFIIIFLKAVCLAYAHMYGLCPPRESEDKNDGSTHKMGLPFFYP